MIEWTTAADVGRKLDLTPEWVSLAARDRRMAKSHFVFTKVVSGTAVYCAVTVNDLWPYIRQNMDDLCCELYGGPEYRHAFTKHIQGGLSYGTVETLIRRMDRG